MKAFKRGPYLHGAAGFRNYEFYTFVCPAPDNKPGEDVWLAYVPELDVATEGNGREDAFAMAKDAGSMMLDNMPVWVRPGCSVLSAHDALEATKVAFEDVPDKWERGIVRMELPYKGWRDR